MIHDSPMTLLFGADSACYLGCIHTCLVLFSLIKINSGLFPPMVRIFWAGVNTVIALWCATKQPNQDPAEEVVSVRSQTNSGMVRLICEYELASIRPNCRKHAQKRTARAYSTVVCISIASITCLNCNA